MCAWLHGKSSIDIGLRLWHPVHMRYEVQTAVRLDKDIAEKLAKIAIEMDRSTSWLIRNAVTEWVKAYKPAKKA